jgi:hypothetical protein
MKALGIFSILLGLAACVASLFAKFETWGNFKAMSESIGRGETNLLETRLVADYADTLNKLHYVAWACGGLALILGVVVMAKRRGTNLIPGLGALLGVAGAALTFLTLP